MPKVAVEVDAKQIERMISQLNSRRRIQLIQRLERKTWGERLSRLLSQIDKRRKKHPITQKEILKILKQARKERYAASRS